MVCLYIVSKFGAALFGKYTTAGRETNNYAFF